MDLKDLNLEPTTRIETFPIWEGSTVTIMQTKFGPGMRVGTAPKVVKIDPPAGKNYGPLPEGWFVLPETSWMRLREELLKGTIPLEIMHAIYKQAWEFEYYKTKYEDGTLKEKV